MRQNSLPNQPLDARRKQRLSSNVICRAFLKSRELTLSGYAAVMCGKALPFRQTGLFILRLCRQRGRPLWAQPKDKNTCCTASQRLAAHHYGKAAKNNFSETLYKPVACLSSASAHVHPHATASRHRQHCIKRKLNEQHHQQSQRI